MNSKLAIVGITSFCTYLCTYFLNLSMDNFEQYLAVVAVLWLDGIFGIWAGVKREGFKTYKALKITRNTFLWLVILTVILMVEKGFTGTGWLSEVIIVPFMVLQLISALKNASMAGLIKVSELNKILDRIDSHKGLRG
jgi:phage-related holin